MKTTTKNTGIKVNTNVKAGGWVFSKNHSATGLKVKAGIKAGSIDPGLQPQPPRAEGEDCREGGRLGVQQQPQRSPF